MDEIRELQILVLEMKKEFKELKGEAWKGVIFSAFFKQKATF
ncbi:MULTISPECIES: hypothetical protein [Methanobacterium]|jgi:hypothetical protein|nr:MULTISPECIES: hypothetical protein [Methanobacterium]